MSSSFGTLFRVTTFGESHCRGVGAIVDGCPPGIALDETDIQPQLDRRRPGQSKLTTDRQESDRVTILSGTENGLTLGTPIGLLVPNKDQRPGDYKEMSTIPRPSHADFTYQAKYGIRASSGGGRSSARETIGRVAAGAIAEKVLWERYGIEIVGWVSAVGTQETKAVDLATIDRSAVDASPVRCPDLEAADRMQPLIRQAKDDKDSLGGILTCVCRGVPAGWGEPVFDKLEAKLAHAMLSIPATKGFEIGSGFSGTRLRGSEHNDPFMARADGLGTVTNNSGGIQGGISNGETIVFRVAFKPPATIGLPQETVDFKGYPVTLAAKGRHDPCVVPRAVPIVEAMTALVLMDAALRQTARGMAS
jgi:chorismate synthase